MIRGSNKVRNPDLVKLQNEAIEKFGAEEWAKAREQTRIKRELAKALRERRIELAMDQKELAKYLHTTQQQLSKYEVGENSPTMDRFYEMCKYLDVDIVLKDKKTDRILVSI